MIFPPASFQPNAHPAAPRYRGDRMLFAAAPFRWRADRYI